MAEAPEQRTGDIRPVPDPTILTTEASIRLETMIRTLITTENKHQQELFDQKLLRSETQFNMLELRTAEQKSDTKAALDAALAAQKEAVASQTASSEKSITKSETATIERIKAVETLLSASTRASDDKIDDLKSRIVAIEATKLGTNESVNNTRANSVDTRSMIATIISVVMVVIAIASVAIAILR